MHPPMYVSIHLPMYLYSYLYSCLCIYTSYLYILPMYVSIHLPFYAWRARRARRHQSSTWGTHSIREHILKEGEEAPVEHVGADVAVERREDIVEQKGLAVLVDGPRQCDALLLSPAQIDAPLADLRHVAVGKLIKVGLERARGNRGAVPARQRTLSVR